MREYPKRPLSVTLIGWLFIAAGAVGVAYHATEFNAPDAGWVLAVRLIAVVAGVFMLRAADWARWLALAWLAYHIVIGLVHSVFQGAVHGVLLACVAYLLLRPEANAYFRGRAPSAETTSS